MTEQEKNTLETDPVCGMKVDPSKAKFSMVYQDKTYYFCGGMCLKEFAKKPDYYLTHGPQGMPGHH